MGNTAGVLAVILANFLSFSSSFPSFFFKKNKKY